MKEEKLVKDGSVMGWCVVKRRSYFLVVLFPTTRLKQCSPFSLWVDVFRLDLPVVRMWDVPFRPWCVL